MIQIVIASHGNFAREGILSASMICGDAPANIHTLSIRDGDGGIEDFEANAKSLAEELLDKPILILSDFFGGSPFMTLLSAFRNNEYKLISGFNLPMIIEAFQSGALELEEAAQNILEIGKNVSIRLVDKIQ